MLRLREIAMPLKTIIDPTSLTLQEAVYWILYDNFKGPSQDVLRSLKINPLNMLAYKPVGHGAI